MDRNDIVTNTIVHGNGFSQTRLNDDGTLRLHVWDRRIPRQNIDTEIHNHRFDFESAVLKGCMMSIGLSFVKTPTSIATHRLYTTLPHNIGENNTLVGTDEYGTFYPEMTKITFEGERYSWFGRHYHISKELGTTVTVIKKTFMYKEPAMIACHINETPDNDFHRSHQVLDDWLVDLIAEYVPIALKYFD